MSFRSALVLALTAAALAAQSPAVFTLAGDWDVRVAAPGIEPQTVRVTPPVMLTVVAEKYDAVPVFNPKAGGWVKGAQLLGLKAQETTNALLLDGPSLVLRAGFTPDSLTFQQGRDYDADLTWGTFGRLAESRIQPNQPVYASYRHAQVRLDAVVLTSAGKVELRQGTPRAAAPPLPTVNAGERHLGNIYLPGYIEKLTPDHLYPILESAYPETPAPTHPVIARIAKRLNEPKLFRILAWGDSVTDGAYLPNRPADRWQEQFVARLRARFPNAQIELLTQAWGGRNTRSYLAEPPGSPHNYQETVLALKPDLIISEFVNDASLTVPQVEERYAKLQTDFQSIGADWIILTPHYVRPDWMNLTRERDIDNDPRPYVEGLRQFAARHNVPLADASLRYGRLWRQGIPYNTLMLNAINHPDARGMKLFADALMALFPQR